MENKEYLSEEKYQSANKKIRLISMLILLGGLIISSTLVGIGLYERNMIPKKIETIKEELETEMIEIENKIKPIENEITKLNRVEFDGFNEEYYARKDKIAELGESIQKERKQINAIYNYIENNSCNDDEVTKEACRLEDKLDNNFGYYIPAFLIIFLCLGFSVNLFAISKRREIAAYTTQQVMPLAQEGIEKMAPTVGKAGKEIAKEMAPVYGEMAKEISKGIKEGLKDEEK